MVLAFPSNPAVGQVYQLWTWDGQKWVCSCQGGGGGGIIGNGVVGMPNKTFAFKQTGIYTPSAGITSVIVECIGGGGGGGGAAIATGGAAGGGGGSGGYSRSVLLPAQIGGSQLVTIGAGGASQSDGTATSFGTLVVANGGGQGQGNNENTGFGQPGAGAAQGTGDLTMAGSPGDWGVVPFNLAVGGRGGAMWGGGAPGRGLLAGGAFAGIDAVANSGGGGSGAAAFNNPTTVAGGAGGSGLCIITEYMPPA